MGAMTCSECRRWWSPYLDSELDASKTFEVSEHLRLCEACRLRFEQEARVEGLIKERMSVGDNMPDELWDQICDSVRAAQVSADPSPSEAYSSRRRVFGFLNRRLAMAASILLILTAGMLYWRDFGPSLNRPDRAAVFDGPTTSVAGLLRTATPQLAAFDQKPCDDFARKLDALGRDVLGASIALNVADRAGAHDVQLIDVQTRTDAAGTRYIEVRINCCGKPAILALSERGHVHAVREFQEIDRRCPSAGDPPPSFAEGLAVQTVERNGVIATGATLETGGHQHLGALLASISVNRL